MHKKESDYMLNDDICKLRERLNESIINNEDYIKRFIILLVISLYFLHFYYKLKKYVEK